MSGFAGFFTSPGPSPDAAELLARLGRALPRSESEPPPVTLVLADGGVCLTGRRLARSADGRLAVAFDGTIYNRAALRAEVDAADRDEDLVLALYARESAGWVERLRGPFALAVWDAREDVWLLARDPMGLRSLYYFQDEVTGRLAFATGVRPLAASGAAPRKLDARGLYGFFRHGAVPGPVSLVAGVHALATGGKLSWRAGRITLDRVAVPRRPAAATEEDNPAQAAKSLRAALLDSVDQHLADGAPRAVWPGGGNSAAALLALARETGRAKGLRVMTLGFEGDAPGEIDLARRTAEHFGVTHQHLSLDRERAKTWFDDFLPNLDQPGVHGFPLFALCRFAREEGIDGVLSGIGANEIIGGGAIYEEVPRLLRWNRWFARASGAFLASSPRPDRRRLADFLSRPPTPAGAYAAIRGIHSAVEARVLVARFTDPTGCTDPLPEDLPGAAGFPDLSDEIHDLAWRRHLRDRLLRAVEASGRAYGMDWRLPFVDRQVMETVARIPMASRPAKGRRLLRDAVPEVPSWVDAPGGSGLPFPYDAWEMGDWGTGKPSDAAATHRQLRTWEQKWSLLLFRRWWRKFAKGESANP